MPYIGNTIRAADDYRLIDDISSSFNGSTTSFALQVAGSSPVPFPKSPQQVLISVNGVIQEPDPTGASGFNLVGTNIVFSSAPTNGHAFFGIIYATADYLNAGGNFPSGSVGAPSFTFIGDEDTGIYRKGSGSVGFVSNSTEIANTDSNGITISSGGLILGDSSGASSNRIKLGASNDLQIYHDGSNSYIDETGTGGLLIKSGNIYLRNPSNADMIHAQSGGFVALYHNASKKFETTSSGIAITGGFTTSGDSTFNADVTFTGNTSGRNILFDKSQDSLEFADNAIAAFGTGRDLLLYHDSSDSYIQDNGVGDLFIQSNSSVRIKSADEDAIRCIANAGVKLYFDDNLKFETITNGASITGKLDLSDNLDMPDNAKIVLGTGDDLKIHSDGSTVFYAGDDQRFRNKALDENFLTFAANGSVTAFYDGSNKFQTTSSGVTVTGNIAVTGTVDGVDVAALSSSVSGKLSNVVDDTTPQLGGNLDCNNKVVTLNDSTGSDNNRFKIGNAGDLQIYHDANHSRIVDSGTGHLIIQTSELNLMNAAGTEDMIKCHADGNVELYFDNSKKFQTNAAGILVTGNITAGDNSQLQLGANGDLRMHHNGSDSFIDNNMGDLTISTTSSGDDIIIDALDDVFIMHNGEDMAQFRNDAEVKLYYDGTERVTTSANGADIFSSGNISMDSSASGGLRILGSGYSGAIALDGTAMNIYHNSSSRGIIFGINEAEVARFNTNGHFIPSGNNSRDLGTSSTRWRNLYTNDLNLSNEGGSNDVDSTWGDYTIQEGFEDLFLINNRTGKKFKFNLTEVA